MSGEEKLVIRVLKKHGERIMKYCKECVNQQICNENHWCITMDKGRKYNGEWLCDNFKKMEEGKG